MPTERTPADAELLGLQEDAATGVPFLPAGLSPYFLPFRRMMWTLLRAAERANDLRVYADGDLTIGVRPGRCTIGGSPRTFTGTAALPVTDDAETHVWLAADGVLATGTTGLPAGPASRLPLARIVTAEGAITAVDDLRGQTMLQVPDATLLGLNASAEEIDRVVHDTDALVTADNLSRLCLGDASLVDDLHNHQYFRYDFAIEVPVIFENVNAGGGAGLALWLAQPARFAEPLILRRDPTHGFLTQTQGDQTHTLLGAATVSLEIDGDLTASLTDRLVGVVPFDGVITAVHVSLGTNLQSSNAGDGVSVSAFVNGTSLTTAAASLSSADGAGSVSTAHGDGVPAVLNAGTVTVQRGDVITADLGRVVSGTVSTEARHAAVLVVIRPAVPV